MSVGCCGAPYHLGYSNRMHSALLDFDYLLEDLALGVGDPQEPDGCGGSLLRVSVYTWLSLTNVSGTPCLPKTDLRAPMTE